METWSPTKNYGYSGTGMLRLFRDLCDKPEDIARVRNRNVTVSFGAQRRVRAALQALEREDGVTVVWSESKGWFSSTFGFEIQGPGLRVAEALLPFYRVLAEVA